MEEKQQVEMKIPTHLAVILDGNGRWAKKHHVLRTFGHHKGAITLKNISEAAFNMGVKIFSAYCFSTENWKRSKDEVDYLFSLPFEFFTKYLKKALKDDVKIIFSGDISALPEKTYQVCLDAMKQTENCKSHILNVCFNYGSHDEITKACKEIASDVKDNKISLDDINPQLIENHLYTKGLEPVDLLIRTSNEQRISNFLLWQISYAEIIFSKVLWPDFSKQDLVEAFEEFARRDRRFGGRKS